MAKKQLPLPGKMVKKSNALLRCRWSAESVWEPRLVALLASKVRVNDKDFEIYEIPVSEVMREKCNGGHNYEEIEQVVDRVMSRVITIYDKDGWTKYNLFSRCRYRKKDGILELGLHPDLRQHYLQLQKNFAKYNLLEFLLLPSIYSQRIFEILKSWESEPEVTISLTNLHEMLNVPKSYKDNFKEFRRWILEKAHKDILKHTSLKYEWESIKKGRSVIAVKFIFSKKRALPVSNKKEIEDQKKQSKKNNEDMLRYISCYTSRGAACEGGHQDEKICELCRKFRRK